MRWGQMAPLDDAVLAQNRGALGVIAADVPRPAVREQRIPRIVPEAWRCPAHRLPELCQELLGEERDVAQARTQRGQWNVEDRS